MDGVSEYGLSKQLGCCYGKWGFPKLGILLESYTNGYHNMESMLFLVVPIQVQFRLKAVPRHTSSLQRLCLLRGLVELLSGVVVTATGNGIYHQNQTKSSASSMTRIIIHGSFMSQGTFPLF